MNNTDKKLKEIDLDLFLMQIVNTFISDKEKIHISEGNILGCEYTYIDRRSVIELIQDDPKGVAKGFFDNFKKKIFNAGSSSQHKPYNTTSCKQIVSDILKEMKINEKLSRQNLLTLIVLIENKLSYESIILYMGYFFNNINTPDMHPSKESDSYTENGDKHIPNYDDVSKLILDKFYTNDYKFFYEILENVFNTKLNHLQNDNHLINEQFSNLFTTLESMLRKFIHAPLKPGDEVRIIRHEDLLDDDINLENIYKINKISTDYLIQHCDKYRFNSNYKDLDVKEGDYVIFKDDIRFNIDKDVSVICKKGRKARIVDYRPLLSHNNEKFFKLYYKVYHDEWLRHDDSQSVADNSDEEEEEEETEEESEARYLEHFFNEEDYDYDHRYINISKEQLYDNNLFEIVRINNDCENKTDEINNQKHNMKNNERFYALDIENVNRTKQKSTKKEGGTQKKKSRKCHSYFYNTPPFEIDTSIDKNEMRPGWNKTNRNFYTNEYICRREKEKVVNKDLEEYPKELKGLKPMFSEHNESFDHDEYLSRPDTETFLEDGAVVYNLSNTDTSLNPEDIDKLEKLWFYYAELEPIIIPANPEFNINEIYDGSERNIYDIEIDKLNRLNTKQLANVSLKLLAQMEGYRFVEYIPSLARYSMILRSNFGFEKLKCHDNFKIFENQKPISNDFKHACIPILWFYKIYENYTNLFSEHTNKHLDNLFDTKSMEELLLILKRFILLENNFDEETLYLFIILGALQYITTNIRNHKLHKTVKASKTYKHHKLSIFDRYYKLNYSIMDEIKKNISSRDYSFILHKEVPFIYENIIPYWTIKKMEWEYNIHNNEKQKFIELIGALLQISAGVEDKIRTTFPDYFLSQNSQKAEMSRVDKLIETLTAAQKYPHIRLVQSFNEDGSHSLLPVDINNLPPNTRYLQETNTLIKTPPPQDFTAQFQMKLAQNMNMYQKKSLLDLCKNPENTCTFVIMQHGALLSDEGSVSDSQTPLFFVNQNAGAVLSLKLEPGRLGVSDRLLKHLDLSEVHKPDDGPVIGPDLILSPEPAKSEVVDHFGLFVIVEPKNGRRMDVCIFSNQDFIDLNRQAKSQALTLQNVLQMTKFATDSIKPGNKMPLVVQSCLGPLAESKIEKEVIKPLFRQIISGSNELPKLLSNDGVEFEQFLWMEPHLRQVRPVRGVGPTKCNEEICQLGEPVKIQYGFKDISNMSVWLKFNFDNSNRGRVEVDLSILIAWGHMVQSPNIAGLVQKLTPADRMRLLIDFDTLMHKINPGRVDPNRQNSMVCKRVVVDKQTETMCGRAGVNDSFKLSNAQWSSIPPSPFGQQPPQMPFPIDPSLAQGMVIWAKSNESFIKSLVSNHHNKPTQAGGTPFFDLLFDLFDNEDDEIPDFNKLTNRIFEEYQGDLLKDKSSKSILLELELYFNTITNDKEMSKDSELNDSVSEIINGTFIKSNVDILISYFIKLKKQFTNIFSMNTYQILFIIYASRFIWETSRSIILNSYTECIKNFKLIKNQILNMEKKTNEIKSLDSYVLNEADWYLYYNFNNMDKEEWELYTIGRNQKDKKLIREQVIILTWFRYITLNNISLDNIDDDYGLIISKIESYDRYKGEPIGIKTKKDDDDQDIEQKVIVQYGSKSLNYKIKSYDYYKSEFGKKYLKTIKDNQNFYYKSLDIINEYMKQKYVELQMEYFNIKKLITLTFNIDNLLDIIEKESEKFENSKLFIKQKYIRRSKTFVSTINIPEIKEILTKINYDMNNIEQLDDIIMETKLGEILMDAQRIQSDVLQHNLLKKVNNIIFSDIPELS